MSFFKKLYAASMISTLSIVSGCSIYAGVENSAPKQKVINTNSQLFDERLAINIVDSVKETQAKRELEAWHKGPSALERMSFGLNGKSPRDGWQPEINHPDNEMNALEHYKDGISLSHLLKPTPATVLMNDDLILISLPNDWLWGRTYEQFTIPAEPYLERLAQNIGAMRGRVNVQSFPPNWQVTLNRQALTTVRAEKLAEYVSLNAYKTHGMVKGLGFGNAISSAEYLDDATVIELRHPFKVDSKAFLPNENVDAFDWYGYQ